MLFRSVDGLDDEPPPLDPEAEVVVHSVCSAESSQNAELDARGYERPEAGQLGDSEEAVVAREGGEREGRRSEGLQLDDTVAGVLEPCDECG